MSVHLLRAGRLHISSWSSIRPRLTRTLRTSTRSTDHAPPRMTRSMFASGAALVVTLAFAHSQSPIRADSASEDADKDVPSHRPTPLSALVRSYVVYTACSIPGLVDWSPSILSTLLGIPVLKQITEAVVRITFFDQFVGGDTAHATLPLLKDLRSENKGCLFAYSVEVDEAEAEGNASIKKQPVHKRIVQEMIRCIDLAADFEDENAKGHGRRTWVAVKLTALLPNASSLVALSTHIINTRSQSAVPIAFPGKPEPLDLDILHTKNLSPDVPLSQEDIDDLHDLHENLVKICTRAQERGVKIILDAEYSWYQPAVDAFGLSMMRQFNKTSGDNKQISPPLVYVTFQAYLRRNKNYLIQSLADAKGGGYAFGVKLVRGAYHTLEQRTHETRKTKARTHSISPDELPPVWSTKAETDACYNECVQILVSEIARDVAQVPSSKTRLSSLSFFGLFGTSTSSGREQTRNMTPSVSVLFGSHNWESVRLILDTLVEKRLASVVGLADGEAVIQVSDEVAERVTMAQLYGMADTLTNYIVDRTRSSSPMVLKYVPYGALVEVLPYLSRRAIENKSVLGGGAAVERKSAAAGIWAKIFG